jgi:hypothetical protein
MLTKSEGKCLWAISFLIVDCVTRNWKGRNGAGGANCDTPIAEREKQQKSHTPCSSSTTTTVWKRETNIFLLAKKIKWKMGAEPKVPRNSRSPPVPLVLPPLLAHTSPDDLSCDTPKKKKERKQLSGQMDVCRDTHVYFWFGFRNRVTQLPLCSSLCIYKYSGTSGLRYTTLFRPSCSFFTISFDFFCLLLSSSPPPPFCCCKETNSFLAASSFESRSGYPTEIIKIIKTKKERKILGATRIVCVSALLIYKCITSPQTRRRRIQWFDGWL